MFSDIKYSVMQNPNEDTEWNDVLRAKGILPAKPKEAEVTEDDLIRMVEQTIKQKSGSKCYFDKRVLHKTNNLNLQRRILMS